MVGQFEQLQCRANLLNFEDNNFTRNKRLRSTMLWRHRVIRHVGGQKEIRCVTPPCCDVRQRHRSKTYRARAASLFPRKLCAPDILGYKNKLFRRQRDPLCCNVDRGWSATLCRRREIRHVVTSERSAFEWLSVHTVKNHLLPPCKITPCQLFIIVALCESYRSKTALLSNTANYQTPLK